MISLRDTFARRDKCVNIYTSLQTLLSTNPRHTHRPWRLTYIIPAAMCNFKHWDDWEKAVMDRIQKLQSIGYTELVPDTTPADRDEVFPWLGNAMFLPYLVNQVNITPDKPFESAMVYIPYMIAMYGYQALCEQLWSCVR